MEQNPAIDFRALLAQTRENVERVHTKKQFKIHLKQMGVTVFANAGEPHFVDGHTIALKDETRLLAAKFILWEAIPAAAPSQVTSMP